MGLAEALDAKSFKAQEIEKREFKYGVSLESTGASQDIKKAYLNYFWDTKAFIGNIEKSYVINK